MMSMIKLRLTPPAGEVEVTLERKRIKNIRLKVYPDGSIRLSAPHHVPEQYLVDFLKKRTAWIEKSLQYYAAAQADQVENRICSGASIRILGRQTQIVVTEAKSYKVKQRGDCIYIKSPAGNQGEALERQFQRWWQKQSKAYFSEVIDKLYPIVAKYGVARPSLQVRKMRTLWGSCSRRHGKINLNYYLFKAPPSCIDYVVLHELAHFIYPRHDKDFYDFLTVHMPDWKERKKMLDHQVVRALEY